MSPPPSHEGLAFVAATASPLPTLAAAKAPLRGGRNGCAGGSNAWLRTPVFARASGRARRRGASSAPFPWACSPSGEKKQRGANCTSYFLPLNNTCNLASHFFFFGSQVTPRTPLCRSGTFGLFARPDSSKSFRNAIAAQSAAELAASGSCRGRWNFVAGNRFTEGFRVAPSDSQQRHVMFHDL